MRPLFTLPLPRSLIDAFNNSGFSTYEDLFQDNGSIDELADGILKDYSFSVENLQSLVRLPNVTSASLKLRGEEFRESIPTFSEALDQILGGGVHLDSILHVCGPPGSGKTLLALQLCVAVQIPPCLGGLGGEAVFIDTDSGFTMSRLKEIAEGAFNHCRKVATCHNLLNNFDNFTVDSMLENIHYLSVRGHIQFMAAIQVLEELVSKHPKIKVVVVDCLTFPFLTFPNTLDRTRILYTIINRLNELADTYNLAVVVTNHLTTKISKNSKHLVPSLGESLSHRIPQILLLGKVHDLHSAVVIKSPYLPQVVVHFNIVKDGLRDIYQLPT